MESFMQKDQTAWAILTIRQKSPLILLPFPLYAAFAYTRLIFNRRLYILYGELILVCKYAFHSYGFR